MTGLSDSEVVKLLPLLIGRGRAKPNDVSAFRPSQVGIVESASAERHVIVTGRRGVGKSMLLLSVQQRAEDEGRSVTYIDIETLRDNPYPDVLIRILIAIAENLSAQLPKRFGRQRKARAKLETLRKRLADLLTEPQLTEDTLIQTERIATQSSISGGAGFSASGPELMGTPSVSADVSGGRSHESQREERKIATYPKTKMQTLRASAPDFREALGDALKAHSGKAAMLVLDDFHYVPAEDQPDVLTYLQQIIKNLDIWLKIAGVEHRLRTFADGDPPRGLQQGQDAGVIEIGLSLESFESTQQFLEGILRGICDEVDIEIDRLVTDGARTRLTLASGGVPRDYLHLTQLALNRATLREDSPQRPRGRINAEDVNDVASVLRQQKEDDLSVDAGHAEGPLRERLRDLVAFCIEGVGSNVFSVEATLLEEEEWGQEIKALTDLRFVHRIGNFTIKSSSPDYPGVRYQGFTLDLSTYADRRVTRGLDDIEFWTTAGGQQIRGARLIYKPNGEPTPETEPAGVDQMHLNGISPQGTRKRNDQPSDDVIR